MSKTKETVITPFGEIKFLAVVKPMPKFAKPEEKEFVVRIEFDGARDEVQKLKEKILELDGRKIITKKISKPENFILVFNSNYAPDVFNAEGTKLAEDDVPFFDSRVDTGLARMEAEVKRNGEFTSLYLKSVQLKDLNISEKEDLKDKASELELLIKKAAGE